MRRVLATERGGELYRKRQPMIEPVFAQMKFNRGLDRFRRRGRGAVRSEWRLITATHNLLKLHRHTTRGRLNGGRRPPARRAGRDLTPLRDRRGGAHRTYATAKPARSTRGGRTASAAMRDEEQ